MGEDGLRKVHTNGGDGLPLRLVDGQGERGHDGELLALEFEWQLYVVRRHEGELWEEDTLAAMVSCDDICFYDVPMESATEQPCPVAQSLCRVKVTKADHGQSSGCDRVEKLLGIEVVEIV